MRAETDIRDREDGIGSPSLVDGSENGVCGQNSSSMAFRPGCGRYVTFLEVGHRAEEMSCSISADRDTNLGGFGPAQQEDLIPHSND